ncbi:transposase [Ruegeria sp. HKCCA6837]|uniref:transposase n=1 Tax=Ruegeria sp. HKCCA6837 TaxID=2682989 RepID=UPI00352E017A
MVQRRVKKLGDTRAYPRTQTAQNNRPIRHAPLQTRNRIEIMFGRLKDWRRVATRYDRCLTVFLSAITLAGLVIYWL